MRGWGEAEAVPWNTAGADGHVAAVGDGPVDFEDGDAAGDGIQELVNCAVEIVLALPGGSLLVVEDVLDETGFLQCGGGGLAAFLRPWLQVERELADGVLELVQVGAEALPGVLHRVEQFVLQDKVAARALLQQPAERLGVEIEGDGRELVVAVMGLDDRALNGRHAKGFSHGGTKARKQEVNRVSLGG